MYVLRPLFTRFQKELASYANTQTGRDFISGFGGKEIKENYPIVKITPDSVHQKIGKNKYRAVFYPRSPFVGKFAEALTMADIAEANKYKVEEKLKEFVIPHYLGETNRLKNVLPTIYVDSGTFNPDADPESTSVDGVAHHVATESDWGTLVAGAGTTSNDTATTLDYFYLSGNTTNKWERIARVVILFDTSSLADDAVISAATYSAYQNTTFINTYSGAVCLVQSAPASNTAVAAGDYDSVGTTQQATDVNMSAIAGSLNSYIDWSLNATGLASISKTSVTKFGMRFSNDRTDSAPSWQQNLRNQLTFVSADSASNKPKLVVTYTLPTTATGYFHFI